MSKEIKNRIERWAIPKDIKLRRCHLGEFNVNKWSFNCYMVGIVRDDSKPSLRRYITIPEYKAGIGIKEPPVLTDILFCLIMELIEPDTRLGDWAREFGYTDIDQAIKTFDAVKEQSEKVRSFFSESEISELREILQDY